ncbi:MAG: ORF6N domain-containing protein, partial [Planctomycetes bacterium]|nr:ORF6N domain-containing protein [Planctomycetota bacterium]
MAGWGNRESTPRRPPRPKRGSRFEPERRAPPGGIRSRENGTATPAHDTASPRPPTGDLCVAPPWLVCYDQLRVAIIKWDSKHRIFQLSQQELEDWRSRIVISNPSAKMGLRRRPYAFTEHGVAMLSSVLR